MKVTANAAGIYNHFHEVKIFEKNRTFVNNFWVLICLIKQVLSLDLKKYMANIQIKKIEKNHTKFY